MTRTITLWGFAVLAAVGVLFHAAGAVWRRTMTFGEFVGLFLRWPLTRWVFVATWLWIGWHLFVRVDR
jgi:hypothetical protein